MLGCSRAVSASCRAEQAAADAKSDSQPVVLAMKCHLATALGFNYLGSTCRQELLVKQQMFMLRQARRTFRSVAAPQQLCADQAYTPIRCGATRTTFSIEGCAPNQLPCRAETYGAVLEQQEVVSRVVSDRAGAVPAVAQ